MGKQPFRYLLGDHPSEALRLERQARLWDPVAHAFFDRLRVKKDSKVLEIGPGRGSLHLELRRRVSGPIDAVERSSVFASSLVRATRRDGWGEGRIWISDLADADLPKNAYDLIFVRWVFLFLPNPEAHLRQLVRSLKPGGKIAVQDYHRETLALIPKPLNWDEFVQADRAFFAAHGGNASIGSELPKLFRKVGLVGIELKPHILAGHPGSTAWNWLTDYFNSVKKQYSNLSPLDQKKATALFRDWKRLSKNSESLLIAPTLLDIVGTKRVRR